MSNERQDAQVCTDGVGADTQYLMQWFKVLLAAQAMTVVTIGYLAVLNGGMTQ